MYAISQAAYSQVQQEAPEGTASNEEAPNTEAASDDDVIDAEYTKE